MTNPLPTRAPAPTPGKARSFNRVTELVFYGVAPLATLVTAPLLARGLGPVERGQYGVAIAVATFALTLGAWGQAETYLGEARNNRLRFTQQARITWVGGTLFGAVTFVALTVLGIPWSTAILTAIWVPLLSQANLWRSVSVAAGRLKEPALFNAFTSLFRVAALLLLAFGTVLNINTAMTATQATMALAAIVTLWLVVRRLHPVTSEPLVPVPTLLKAGGAIITFSVLNAITLRSDLVVLQLFASPHSVGLYAAPASLTTAALALSSGFKSRLQAAAFSTHSGASMAREAVPVLILGLIGALVLWFSAPLLVHLFFGPQYEGSIPLLRLLGFAAVPLLMLDLAQGVLIVLAKRRQLIVVASIGAAAVLLSLIALSATLGPFGAAVACIVGYSVAAAVAWGALILDTRKSSRTDARAEL